MPDLHGQVLVMAKEYDRLREVERVAGEFVEKSLRGHRLANPDGACGCGLCNQALELKNLIRVKEAHND